MDDQQILDRGGTEHDIRTIAEANGADLKRKDFCSVPECTSHKPRMKGSSRCIDHCRQYKTKTEVVKPLVLAYQA